LDFEGLNARLIGRCPDLLAEWFPNGKVHAGEFVVGSINGEAGNSLKINWRKGGVWADFAAGDTGGDLIELYARINRLEQGEAYKQIRLHYFGEGADSPPISGPAPPAPSARKDDEWQLSPIPEFAPTDVQQFIHPTHGVPSQVWWYTDTDGRKLFAQCRYETQKNGKPHKEFCPWTWHSDAWRMKAPPRPRPLYGLDRLYTVDPTFRVLVVEGEKAAHALRQVFKRQTVISAFGGVAGVKHADWRPLEGRRCLLWPDADEPGRKAMQEAANALLALGCTLEMVYPPDADLPEGWDAADAVEDGWTLDEFRTFLTEHIAPIGSTEKPLQTTGPGPRQPPEKDPGAEPAQAASRPGKDIGSMAQRHLWEDAGLACRANGEPYCNDDNAARILRYAEGVSGKIDLWWDEFLRRIMYRADDGKALEWSDDMDTRLTQWVQRAMGMPNMGVDTMRRAVVAYARQSPRNCVKEWLTGILWDGQERLPRLCAEGFGATDNTYSAAVGRCFMVGMVARVLAPGCKADAMPVFEGTQGAGKTSALEVIGGEWYTAVHSSILSKDFCLDIQGKMLVEISELHSFRRAEQTAIKGKISSRIDRFRSPYGRHAEDWPRTNVFAGTTNEDDWNTDETGARRFWPVYCHRVNLDWIKEHRDQLFAESVARYQRGEPWWNVPEEAARKRQEARRVDDPWYTRVTDWCAARDRVTSADVLTFCLDVEPGRQDRLMQTRISAILKSAGYVRKTISIDGKVMKGFALNPRTAGILAENRRPLQRPLAMAPAAQEHSPAESGNDAPSPPPEVW
jgi:hypothetical protein